MVVLVLILAIVAAYTRDQYAAMRTPTPRPHPNSDAKPIFPAMDRQVLITTEKIDFFSALIHEIEPPMPKLKGLVAQRTLNLNHKATFTNTEEPIVCRHISHSVLRDLTPSGDVDLRPYSSIKSIAKKIPFGIETYHLKVTQQLADVHLIENEKLGQWLVLQFRDMTTHKVPLQKILVESTDHDMGLWLTLAYDLETPQYGVHFYDPNFTVVYISATSDSLDAISRLSLKSFMPETTYSQYYPAPLETAVSMLFVLPHQTKETPEIERRSISHTNVLTQDVLFQLMRNNFHEVLRSYFTTLTSLDLSKKERLSLVADTRKDGAPGLYAALHRGNSAAISVYLEGIKSLGFSQERLFSLAEARNHYGVPGLHTALQKGDSASTSAYFEGIKALGFSQEARLSLAAAMKDGTPGLFEATHHDSSAVIVAYIAGIKSLGFSHKEILSLVEAKRQDGVSGLYVALQEGKSAAISGYMAGIKSLGFSQNEILPIVVARRRDGLSGFYIALQAGNGATIAAYMEGIKSLGFSKDAMLSLVTAKKEAGVPGLFVALQVGNSDAVSAYLAGIDSFGFLQKEILSLTEAKKPDGLPGLCAALQRDSSAAISAYLEGIKSLNFSKKEILSLVAAKTKEGMPGFYLALNLGNNAAISAYLEGVKSLGVTKNEVLSFINNAPVSANVKERSASIITEHYSHR